MVCLGCLAYGLGNNFVQITVNCLKINLDLHFFSLTQVNFSEQRISWNKVTTNKRFFILQINGCWVCSVWPTVCTTVWPMVWTTVWPCFCSVWSMVWRKFVHSGQWWSKSVWYGQGWPKSVRSDQYLSLGMVGLANTYLWVWSVWPIPVCLGSRTSTWGCIICLIEWLTELS